MSLAARRTRTHSVAMAVTWLLKRRIVGLTLPAGQPLKPPGARRGTRELRWGGTGGDNLLAEGARGERNPRYPMGHGRVSVVQGTSARPERALSEMRALRRGGRR